MLGLPLWLIGALIAFVSVTGAITYFMIKKRSNQFKAAQEVIKEQEELEEIATDFQDKSSPKYQIEKFIDAKPDAVAQLLRSWLNED